MGGQLNTKTTCVIDDNGDVHENDWSSPQGLLDIVASPLSAVDRRVPSKKCIAVAFARNVVRLSFDPVSVSPIAIGGLLYYLHDKNAHRRTGLKFCLINEKSGTSAGRVIEVFRTLKGTINRLQFLSDDAKPGKKDRFAAIAMDPSLTRYHRAFARLMASWRAYSGRFDAEAIMPVLRYEFADRYCLFEMESPTVDFRIVAVGAGLRIPDPTVAASTSGSRLSALPDFRYAEWLEVTFLRVVETNTPDFSDVSVRVFWPSSGLVARQYRRLLLPWRNAEGRMLLLSASKPLKLPDVRAGRMEADR